MTKKKLKTQPVEAPMVMMVTEEGMPFWALPMKKGWQLMSPRGNQMLTLDVPNEIIEQLAEYKVKMEE